MKIGSYQELEAAHHLRDTVILLMKCPSYTSTYPPLLKEEDKNVPSGAIVGVCLRKSLQGSCTST